jgi:methylglutaconyl-CoA hydratase
VAIVHHQHTDSGILQITLNNPEMRNAINIEMFDAIDEAIEQTNTQTKCVLLKGEGVIFCSGFDMKACAGNLPLLEQYILRLTALIRTLRRLPAPVVVAAHGAAIAGGCAILTGCDFAIGSQVAKYGYPVHRIGISPAVTIPTLFQKLGEGRARTLVLSGEIIDGSDAYAIGLLSHLEETDEQAIVTANELAEALAQKPPIALRATKRWLNELDGSLDDERFDKPANQSASDLGEETEKMLNQLWNK